MDGVLVDSKQAMEKAWNITCKNHAIKPTFKDYLKHVGKPFKEILYELNIPDKLHNEIKSTYGLYASSYIKLISPYKHTIFSLKKLKRVGYKIGIVTSKEYWRADLIVDSFLLTCDVLITPEHTKLGKPYPDPILEALSKLKTNKKNAFYVGDMSSDRCSAVEAGVTFFKANWGYGDFSHSGVCFDSFIDLLEYLYIE